MYLNKETLHQYTMFMSIFRENINLDSRYIHHFYLNTLHKPPRYLSSIHNLQIPKIFQDHCNINVPNNLLAVLILLLRVFWGRKVFLSPETQNFGKVKNCFSVFFGFLNDFCNFKHFDFPRISYTTVNDIIIISK